MAGYASVNDVITLWRALTPEEIKRTEALIPHVTNALRYEAQKVGKDLDRMAEDDYAYADVIKMVTVDVIGRILRQDTVGEAMTQESQSGLGYTWSGTYAIPGGGIAQAIMKNDLKRLGLSRQQIGIINLMGEKPDETDRPWDYS